MRISKRCPSIFITAVVGAALENPCLIQLQPRTPRARLKPHPWTFTEGKLDAGFHSFQSTREAGTRGSLQIWFLDWVPLTARLVEY